MRLKIMVEYKFVFFKTMFKYFDPIKKKGLRISQLEYRKMSISFKGMILNNDVKSVRHVLVNLNFDIDLNDFDDILLCIIAVNSLKILKILESIFSEWEENIYDIHLLFMKAIEANNVDLLDHILKKLVILKKNKKTYFDLIYNACDTGNVEIMKLVFDRFVGKDSENILIYILKNIDDDIVVEMSRYVITKFPKTDPFRMYGEDLIYHSFQRARKIKFLKFILKFNFEGICSIEDLFNYSIRFGRLDVIKYLDAFIDSSFMKNDNDLINEAIKYYRNDILEFMLIYYSDTLDDNILDSGIMYNNVTAVKKIIKHLSVKSFVGEILIECCNYNRPEMFGLFGKLIIKEKYVLYIDNKIRCVKYALENKFIKIAKYIVLKYYDEIYIEYLKKLTGFNVLYTIDMNYQNDCKIITL